MKPGKVYRVGFDVGWMSQVFNRGHCIRVTVASTGAPFYEPNPNTGEPLTLEWPANAVTAENSVQHNRHWASRVIAPVPSEPGASSVRTLRAPSGCASRGAWRPARGVDGCRPRCYNLPVVPIPRQGQ